MHIKQKLSGIRTEFVFGDEHLDYLINISGNKSGGSIAYENIPTEYSFRRKHIERVFKYLAIGLFFLGLMLMRVGINHGITGSSSVLIAFCVFSLLISIQAFIWKQPTLTFFGTQPALIILHDSHRQTILNEITDRRKEQIRKRHLAVDFLNDPAKEVYKFRFLLNEDYITSQEYNVAIAKIVSSQQKPTSGTLS